MCIVLLDVGDCYYGCKDVFANFVRGPLPIGGNGAGAVAPGAAGVDQTAGALGMGSVAASATTSTCECLPVSACSPPATLTISHLPQLYYTHHGRRDK